MGAVAGTLKNFGAKLRALRPSLIPRIKLPISEGPAANWLGWHWPVIGRVGSAPSKAHESNEKQTSFILHSPTFTSCLFSPPSFPFPIDYLELYSWRRITPSGARCCANRAQLKSISVPSAKMGSRPVTPSNEAYGANPPVGSRPRTMNSRPNSYHSTGALGGASTLEQGQGPHMDSSPLVQSLNKHEDSYGLARHDDASIHDGYQNMTGGELRRSNSQISQSQNLMASRGGTLKKKASLKRTGSMKRSSSKRSSRAGSVRSLALGEKEKYGEGEEFNSAFYTPVPTAGSPTDILANRFQGSHYVLRSASKRGNLILYYFWDI
jgi:hypothetical protein